MSGKGKSAYERLSESVKNILPSVFSSASAVDAKLTFNPMEIAKFTGLPPDQALDKKVIADKNKLAAQGLRDDYAVWKEEQNNKIQAFEEKATRIFETEKSRLLISHNLKDENDLKTNKAPHNVSTRWRATDTIQKGVQRRIESIKKEKMADYKDCKKEVGSYLFKELDEKNDDLDKYHDECCTKALIGTLNFFWSLPVFPGLFKQCSKNGSYFFSKTGKTYEAVEAVYQMTCESETKRCCF